jgi:hypothetical protein
MCLVIYVLVAMRWLFIFLITLQTTSASVFGHMETESDGIIVPSCASDTASTLHKALCFFAEEKNGCGVFRKSSLALQDPHLVCGAPCAPHMDSILRATDESPLRSEILHKLSDSLSSAHCRYCRHACWMLNWVYY